MSWGASKRVVGGLSCIGILIVPLGASLALILRLAVLLLSLIPVVMGTIILRSVLVPIVRTLVRCWSLLILLIAPRGLRLLGRNMILEIWQVRVW